MMPLVFVSRPSVLSEDQAGTFQAWRERLSLRGFRTTCLLPADYDAVPWIQLTEIIGGADGALVLGFAVADADADDRERTGRHETVWNHVEAGMAIMSGVPVAAATNDRAGRGIFASSTWGQGVFGVPLDVDPTQERLLEPWEKAVRLFATRGSGARRAAATPLEGLSE